MPKKGLFWLFFSIFSDFLVETFAFTCRLDEPATAGSKFPYYTYYIACADFFETCCEEGCCPKFTHIHIWLTVTALSFLLFLSLFGIWYCRKKSRSGETSNEEHANTLLAQVTHENRNVNPNNSNITSSVYGVTPTEINYGAQGSLATTNRNTAEPITPPPSYEEAVAGR